MGPEELREDSRRFLIFDGNNYQNWKFRMEVYLEEQDLLKYVLEDPKEEDTWKKNDKKCKMILISRIDDTRLENVKGKKTSKEIWDSLSAIYERKSVASQLYLRKKLITMKYDTEKEDLKQFFLRFDRTIQELNAAGAKLEDIDISYVRFSTGSTVVYWTEFTVKDRFIFKQCKTYENLTGKIKTPDPVLHRNARPVWIV